MTGKDAARVELLPPSFTLRVGNRRLTMSRRPRKPVPTLLTGLLRRSWRAMFGKSLRISVTAAAICAAWNVSALAAAPPVNTLPTGGAITYGNATITQNGNTLNINQTSGQAIGSFTTFSIGSNAVVDISQPNAAAAFLARVTGSDPSLIYGLLKSNGTVALINQNGILVGPTGVVDVARFIASTLNISDSDFLAGRLTFNNGATAGSVENQGTIKSATGGSVYLIGANVTNSGVITSPNGEILLAAGQTVQLVDTATPGVSVNVTGSAGSVTNLGTISAAAGRIGIAAGLINNSGNINASSVVSDGGRIFLRASQNLTTTASSNISADGASTGKGGSVVLYSDKVAYLDGDISARGAAGKGGYVETSGKQSLDVIKLPTVGSGGEWYIDPYDLEVVSSGGAATSNVSGVITSVGSSAKIEAVTVANMLNDGVSVTLVTGEGGAANGGNITVNSAINKTSGSAASLTLNANNSIAVNADITSTSGALNLNLNSNLSGIAGDHTVNVTGATIKVNGGILSVNDGSGNSGNGNITLKSGATIDLDQSGTLNAGTLAIANGGTLSSTYNAGVHLLGDLNNSGTVGLNNSAISIGGKLINQGTGTVNLANVSGTLGNVTNSGTMTLASMFQGITATAFNNSGSLALSNTSTLNAGAMTNSGTVMINGSTLNVSTLSNSGTASVVDGTLSATDTITNAGLFTIGNSTVNTQNGFINNLGATLNLNNYTSFSNAGILQNTGTMNVLGSTTTNGDVTNDATGVINLGSDSSFLTISGNGGWTNNGSMLLSGTSRTVQITNAAGLTNNINGTVTLGGSSTLYLTSMTNNGNLAIGSGAALNGSTLSNSGTTILNGGSMVVNTVTNNLGGNISGNGSISASGQFTNNGVLSPGGDGTVGALGISGNFSQGASGVLNIDVASASSYDTLTINAPTTVQLGGTLQSKLLNAYVPALGTSLTPIVFTNSNAGSSYFRHVLGDVINTGSGLQMLKVDYKSGLSLVMSGSENFTFSGGDGGNWGSLITWGGVGYLPTAIDNVSVSSGSVLSHSDGTDIVNSITINGGELQLLGGTVKTTNLTSTGRVTIGNHDGGSGSLNVSGTAQMSSLNIDGSGYSLNGTTGSTITVNGTFSQTGGAVISSDGDVALTQVANPDAEVPGNLMVGTITARNLVLQAQGGSIRQNEVTQLHVRQQLTTASSTGTTLTNSGNQIAAYTGANTGVGNIALTNTLNVSDTSVVLLNGITNAAGNVTVDNTGAMATTGSISALNSTLHSTVSLSTHSPLTIGSGGVSANGNILLSAGNSGSATDNLIINGVVTSAGGNINLFAGNSMSVNANISTSAPGQALFNVVNGTVTYAPGVSITDVSGTQIPVAAVIAQVVTPVVTQTIAPAANTVITSTTSPQSTTVTVVAPALSSTSSTNTATETMTTGGDPGTFGGSDTSGSGKSSTSEKTGTKTASKLYCS